MLVVMWRLEAYLARAVGEALRHRVGGRPEPQDGSHHLDTAGRHVLKPDLVHYLPSPHDGVQRPAVVVDAEFKTRPQRDDLYQMTAYCVRLGLGEGHPSSPWRSPSTARVPRASLEERLRVAVPLGPVITRGSAAAPTAAALR